MKKTDKEELREILLDAYNLGWSTEKGLHYWADILLTWSNKRVVREMEEIVNKIADEHSCHKDIETEECRVCGVVIELKSRIAKLEGGGK